MDGALAQVSSDQVSATNIAVSARLAVDNAISLARAGVKE